MVLACVSGYLSDSFCFLTWEKVKEGKVCYRQNQHRYAYEGCLNLLKKPYGYLNNIVLRSSTLFVDGEMTKHFSDFFSKSKEIAWTLFKLGLKCSPCIVLVKKPICNKRPVCCKARVFRYLCTPLCFFHHFSKGTKLLCPWLTKAKG